MRLRLKRLRDDRDLTQQNVADYLGVDVGYYNRMENETRPINSKWLIKLAELFQCNVPDLFALTKNETSATSPISLIYVMGRICEGSWVVSWEFELKKRYQIMVPKLDEVYPTAFALELYGPAMNLEYTDGSILVCVPMDDYANDLQSGDHVVIQTTSDRGLVELSCRELRLLTDQEAYLWPRSDHPDYQQPIALKWPEAAGKTPRGTIQVLAVIHASYQQRRKIVR